jgi:caffeoyl-CoA O-methyltransferase
MSKIVYDYVEDYIRNMIPQNDELLKSMEDYALENNVPIVQREVAKLLSLIIKMKDSKNILEIGTAIGYSAIMMNKASNNAKIVTIERNKDMIEKAEENIKSAGLENSIQVIEGDALEVLPKIDDKFDLIFIDAAKGQYKEFFSYCDRCLKLGGIIFADNVLFRGMIANNDLVVRRKITIVKRMRNYLEFISKNKNYETSILSIGDGVAISLKTGDEYELEGNL